MQVTCCLAQLGMLYPAPLYAPLHSLAKLFLSQVELPISTHRSDFPIYDLRASLAFCNHRLQVPSAQIIDHYLYLYRYLSVSLCVCLSVYPREEQPHLLGKINEIIETQDSSGKKKRNQREDLNK